MNLLEKKLWEILELARDGDLNDIAMGYLKDGLGSFFAKYVYDRDLTYLQYMKWLESDIKAKRIDKINLYQSLYKIFYLHRDLDNAIEFKKQKIKAMKEEDKSGVEFDYYELANINYDKGNHQKALDSLSKVFKRLDTKRLTVGTLELYLRSLIMQNQLKQDIKYPSNEIQKELEHMETVFINTAKHFDEVKQSSLRVQILYLNMIYHLDKKEYDDAIKYGEKILEVLEQSNVPIKISLKYRIYEGLAYSYLLEGKYNKAIDMAKKAINLKNSLLSIDTFSALVVLAESYIALKEYDEALSFAHEANGYVNNSIEKLEYIYELLAKIYKAKDDESSAKEYLEKLCQLQEVSRS